MMTKEKMTQWRGKIFVFIPISKMWKYAGALTEEDNKSIERYFIDKERKR